MYTCCVKHQRFKCFAILFYCNVFDVDWLQSNRFMDYFPETLIAVRS